MEIVLLWLDDLDDLVFAGALALEGVRRLFLKIGLAAACGFAICELTAGAAAVASFLSLIALASVAFWTLAGALELARLAEPARA